MEMTITRAHNAWKSMWPEAGDNPQTTFSKLILLLNQKTKPIVGLHIPLSQAL